MAILVDLHRRDIKGRKHYLGTVKAIEKNWGLIGFHFDGKIWEAPNAEIVPCIPHYWQRAWNEGRIKEWHHNDGSNTAVIHFHDTRQKLMGVVEMTAYEK